MTKLPDIRDIPLTVLIEMEVLYGCTLYRDDSILAKIKRFIFREKPCKTIQEVLETKEGRKSLRRKLKIFNLRNNLT